MTPASRVLMDSSPFSMFFQSLLPNFNVNELAVANNENRPAIDPVVRVAGDANNPAAVEGADGKFQHLFKFLSYKM